MAGGGGGFPVGRVREVAGGGGGEAEEGGFEGGFFWAERGRERVVLGFEGTEEGE